MADKRANQASSNEDRQRLGSGGPSPEIRFEVARVLTERADVIVNDSVAMFPYSGPQPLETDLGRNRVERTAVAPASLSVQSAAHDLQCSPAVVQKLIAEGRLKTTGTGAALRIHSLAVEDYRSAKVLDIKPRPNLRN